VTFLFRFLELLFQVLTFCIIVRVVLSWISPGQNNIVATVIYHITEPILAPIRRILPKTGVFDFAPMVAVIILQLIVFIILPLLKP
jgi:YggT family protein